MSKNILILAVVVFFAGSVLAKIPEPVNSAPPGGELEKFPFFKQGELDRLGASYTESALGLRKEVLKKPMVVLNHFRQDNSWRRQTLPVGDEVYVEKSTGIARYRAACSNRIDPVLPCAKCAEKASPTFSSLPDRPIIHYSGNLSRSWTDRFKDGLADSWSMIGRFLGWLLPLLLLLLLLALAAYGLYRLFQQRQPSAPPIAGGDPSEVRPRRSTPVIFEPPTSRTSFSAVPAKEHFSTAKPEGEKPETATGEFKILKGGKGKPTAYIISGCIVGFEKRADGSFLIREAE